MEDIWLRFAEDFIDRLTGPMKFRLVLQPIVAVFFAIRSGLRDSRAGNPPYFWSLLIDRGHRTEMLRDGWKDVGKVFMLALTLDVIYQFIVARFVYPGEAVIVAVALAIFPYLVLRGLTTRFVRLR